jgi:hypothetical protein
MSLIGPRKHGTRRLDIAIEVMTLAEAKPMQTEKKDSRRAPRCRRNNVIELIDGSTGDVLGSVARKNSQKEKVEILSLLFCLLGPFYR